MSYDYKIKQIDYEESSNKIYPNEEGNRENTNIIESNQINENDIKF